MKMIAITPEEVKDIRINLHLTHKRAGELLGGGPLAFQEYESGARKVDAPMANLLRILEKEPSRLGEIKMSLWLTGREKPLTAAYNLRTLAKNSGF